MEKEESCKLWLEKLSLFLSEYKWLLDSFIIEFFTEYHWSKLPLSWRRSLVAEDNSSLRDIAQLILGNEDYLPLKKVFPLSFLSFVATCRAFSPVRNIPPHDVHDPNGTPQVDDIGHLFWRHVKPKKQHEIKELGKVISGICQQVGSKNVIDIGSGQGHLARYLTFHYGLNVTTMEAVSCHLAAAAKYDSEIRKELIKKRKWNSLSLEDSMSGSKGSLKHIEIKVGPDASMEGFLSQIGHISPVEDSSLPAQPTNVSHLVQMTPNGLKEDALTPASGGKEKTTYILTGLHTCGNLASTMLRVFSESNLVVGAVSVGCCYMKLTSPSSPQQHETPGYPMSRFLRGTISHTPFSYEARELACHSIDAYRERLLGEEFDHLKVHCFRAAVETVLRKHGLRRTQVRISKQVSKLRFRMYTQKLIASVPHAIILNEEDMKRLESMVERDWRSVVIFFMLRLAMAPCAEKMILLDRKLFLIEQGYHNTHLFPVFNPKLSPRNILLLAMKQ